MVTNLSVLHAVLCSISLESCGTFGKELFGWCCWEIVSWTDIWYFHGLFWLPKYLGRSLRSKKWLLRHWWSQMYVVYFRDPRAFIVLGRYPQGSSGNDRYAQRIVISGTESSWTWAGRSEQMTQLVIPPNLYHAVIQWLACTSKLFSPQPRRFEQCWTG